MNICALYKKNCQNIFITYEFSKRMWINALFNRTRKNKYLYIFRVVLYKVFQSLNVFRIESVPAILIFSQDVSQCPSGRGWGGRCIFHRGLMWIIHRRTGAHTLVLPKCACKLNPIVMDKLIKHIHGSVFNRSVKISLLPLTRLQFITNYKIDMYFRFDLNPQ